MCSNCSQLKILSGSTSNRARMRVRPESMPRLESFRLRTSLLAEPVTMSLLLEWFCFLSNLFLDFDYWLNNPGFERCEVPCDAGHVRHVWHWTEGLCVCFFKLFKLNYEFIIMHCAWFILQEKVKPRRTEFKEYEDWLVILLPKQKPWDMSDLRWSRLAQVSRARWRQKPWRKRGRPRCWWALFFKMEFLLVQFTCWSLIM